MNSTPPGRSSGAKLSASTGESTHAFGLARSYPTKVTMPVPWPPRTDGNWAPLRWTSEAPANPCGGDERERRLRALDFDGSSSGLRARLPAPGQERVRRAGRPSAGRHLRFVRRERVSGAARDFRRHFGSGSARAALIADWRGAGRRAAPPVLGWVRRVSDAWVAGVRLSWGRAELGIVASPAGA
jgi:hypothetical protein